MGGVNKMSGFETGCRTPRPVIFRSRLHWLIRESGSIERECNRVLTRPLFGSGLHCPQFGSGPDFTKGLIGPKPVTDPARCGTSCGSGEAGDSVPAAVT